MVLSHTNAVHLVLACGNTALSGPIDFQHSISKAIKICYLVLWFMFLFVLNVTQRKRALSRRTKETEAASNKENKYLYWYFYTLFCTLCNYKVSAILLTGKVCWDALLTERSRARWTRTWLKSPANILCTFSPPMTEIAFTGLTKLCKVSQHLPDTTLDAARGPDSVRSAQSICWWRESDLGSHSTGFCRIFSGQVVTYCWDSLPRSVVVCWAGHSSE